MALIFTALCLVRPGTGILVATSVSGSALVSICASAVLYSLMTITASAGFIGDLLALYNALSAQSILLTWLLGLLLSGGAMLLQSLLLRSVEDVEEDDSRENWSLNDSGADDYEEDPSPRKRGPRRKKKKSIVEPYDQANRKSTSRRMIRLAKRFTLSRKACARQPKDDFDYEQNDDFEETLRTSALRAPENPFRNNDGFQYKSVPQGGFAQDIRCARGRTSARRAGQKSRAPVAEEPAVSEPAAKKPASRLTRPTFPPRSQSRK
ncbi:MAG: hypothetical protein ACLUO4_04710 [Christensenellales bacterium]